MEKTMIEMNKFKNGILDIQEQLKTALPGGNKYIEISNKIIGEGYVKFGSDTVFCRQCLLKYLVEEKHGKEIPHWGLDFCSIDCYLKVAADVSRNISHAEQIVRMFELKMNVQEEVVKEESKTEELKKESNRILQKARMAKKNNKGKLTYAMIHPILQYMNSLIEENIDELIKIGLLDEMQKGVESLGGEKVTFHFSNGSIQSFWFDKIVIGNTGILHGTLIGTTKRVHVDLSKIDYWVRRG